MQKFPKNTAQKEQNLVSNLVSCVLGSCVGFQGQQESQGQPTYFFSLTVRTGLVIKDLYQHFSIVSLPST